MSEPLPLPHAFPFRMIDRGPEGLEVRFSATGSAWASRGGALPPWVVLEAFAQGAGLLLGRPEAPGGVVVQISRYRCPRLILPGQSFTMTATPIKRMGPVFQGRVTARLGGRIAASGTVTIRESAP